MNIKILEKKIQDFIQLKKEVDVQTIALGKSPFKEVSSIELAQQIFGLQIAQKKFKSFINFLPLYFPKHINLEQTSSETTAIYKSSMFTHKKILDGTGGWGIDSFFFSKNNNSITYIEPDEELYKITKYNFKKLPHHPKEMINKTLEEYLVKYKDTFDIIYLDPSRRKKDKKIFLLEEMTPNIIELQNTLLERTKLLVIKLSPLIDITHCISKIKNIKEIHIIAVKNEVKELLIISAPETCLNPQIICNNLDSNEPIYKFNYKDNTNYIDIEYSTAQQYIYIPNNTVLKSGAFKLLSHQMNLKKLHTNTHIYTTNYIIEKFPGRKFELISTIDNSKELKNQKFNLMIKNYPEKIENIKKKYKLQDGGNLYLLFTKDIEKYKILKLQLIK